MVWEALAHTLSDFFFFTKILLSSKDKHDYPQYTNEEAKAQRG